MQELPGRMLHGSSKRRYFMTDSLSPLTLLALFSSSLLLTTAFWFHGTSHVFGYYPTSVTTNGVPSIGSEPPRNETKHRIRQNPPKRIEIPVNCSASSIHTNQTEVIKCPRNYPQEFKTIQDGQSRRSCPDFFKFIYEDLKPWRETGITRDMVERARPTAHFRLVIKNGVLFIEKYKQSIQTRDVFTVWGILQLLRRYPGRVPDLELMFDCDDRPVIRRHNKNFGVNEMEVGLPPLFRYCGDRWTADIVFPDWSFWGWAEINIAPWTVVLEEIKEGNKKVEWMKREPYAYWKGNPFVANTRQDLLKCNTSDHHDWKARLFIQDWILEGEQGYQHSRLADQCDYRYKIYIEGYAWSVSEKYILACNSVTLMVDTQFYDFFSRSLQPLQHYWPVRGDGKCKSIKFAVEWGNSHTQKAQEMGRRASEFMQEDLKMGNVYDYMFHLLNEYAKLLRFEPEIPQGGVEVCSESMVCPRDGRERKFMMESLVTGPSVLDPCDLDPPAHLDNLGRLNIKKMRSIQRVHNWEEGYWRRHNNSN